VQSHQEVCTRSDKLIVRNLLQGAKSMKTFIALIFTIGLTLVGIAAKHASGLHVVLPNSKLIGCKASDCSQLWQDIPTDEAGTYPHNVNIDIENDAVLGIVAHYDKSVSVGDIKASIDDHYGKSTYVIDNETSPVKVWRVEAERIAIQLATEDNGMKQVIYLSGSAWRKPTAPLVLTKARSLRG
jgi:hypothetical protein